MAASILGSSVTPVTGAREFSRVPGTGAGGVSFGSGDTNNYVLTSTGTGDEIQGESNLTFNGTTLGVTGALTVSGASTLSGAVTLDGISSAATATVLCYNTGTGLVTYNTGDGSATKYLNAAGSFTTVTAAQDYDIFENGLTGDESGSTVKLGGALTGHTIISNTSSAYTYNIKSTYTGTDCSWYYQDNTKVDIKALNNDDYGYPESNGWSHMLIDANKIQIRNYSTSSLYQGITFAAANDGIKVIDSSDQSGLYYDANYRTNGVADNGDRWIPDKAYVDDAIDTDIAALNISYKIAKRTLTYDRDGDDIFYIVDSVPSAGVIWDIKVYVTEAFNDTGTNTFSLGISGDKTKYENASPNVLTQTGWAVLSGFKLPDYMTSNSLVYARYDGSNGNSNAGSAVVYVFYSDWL